MIEGTVQARLVTSGLVRTFPGPSGYEVKSQGAGLEATCKHVEVAKSVSRQLGWHLLTGVDFNITETPTEAIKRDNETDSTIPSRSSYVETRDKSEWIKFYKTLHVESIYLMLKLSLEFRLLLENQPAFEASLASSLSCRALSLSSPAPCA